MSLNGLLIVAPYDRGQGVKVEVKSGFATVAQKNDVVGLKLLVAVNLNGKTYPAGSTVFFREDDLASKPWAKEIRKVIGEQESFLIIDSKFALMIQ